LIALVALLAVAATLVTTGALTLDTGWGRRVRGLGPFVVHIAASREIVFDVAATPYASANPPRALREKVTVLERGEGMVVAAHRTKATLVTSVTVESVTLERPERIGFRLLRGPVPHVVERFELAERDGGTELAYEGELGTDFWWPGSLWGRIVAGHWERAVDTSLRQIKESAEQVAERRASRGA
jgi:hypothetical protein